MQYTTKQLCAHLGYSRQTIYRLMKEGKFPRPVKFEDNRAYWSEAVINEWQTGSKRRGYFVSKSLYEKLKELPK